MANNESYLDRLAGTDIPPPQFYRDLPTTPTRPQFISPSGQLSPFRQSQGILKDITEEFVRQGQSLSGNLGIGDIRSPQGAISDAARDVFTSNYYDHLDIEAQKKLDPNFDPVPDERLDTVGASEWYKRSIPQSFKNFVGQYGYTEDFFREGTGREAKRRYEQALFMSRLDQQEEMFQQNSGFFGKATRFVVGDIALTAAADPVTWLTLGYGAVGKRAATTAVLQTAGKEVGLKYGLSRALGNRWIAYGLAGATNAVQYTGQAAAEDARQKEQFGQTTNNLNPEGTVLSFAMGFGLTWGLDSAFTGLSRWAKDSTSKNIRDSFTPDPGLNVHKPILNSQQSIIKAAENTESSRLIADAMKELTGSDQAFHHYWGQAELEDLKTIGLDAHDIVRFLKKNPTDDEIDVFFRDAHAAAFGKKDPSAVVSPTKLIGEHQVTRGLPKTETSVALKFQSHVDKAMYILSTKTKNVELLRQSKSFLRQTFPQLSDVELNAFVQRVNMSVKDAVKALPPKPKGNTLEIPGGLWQRTVDMLVEPNKLPQHVFEDITDLKGRTTAYSRARPQYDALVAQRDALIKASTGNDKIAGQVDTLNRKIALLGGEMTRVRNNTGGAVPRADIDIPDPKPGQYLTQGDASKRLDQLHNQGKINIRTYTARIAGLIPAAVKRPFIAMTSGMAGNDWNRLIYSPFQSVRNLAYIVQGGPLSEESGTGILKRVVGIEEAKRANAAFTARHQANILRLEKGLTRPQVDQVEAEVSRLLMGQNFTGMLDSKLMKVVNEVHAATREYLDHMGQRAYQAGVIPQVRKDYFPTFIRTKDYHKADEIATKVWERWVKEWSAEDADLHVLTLERIGMLDEEGKFNLTRFNAKPEVRAEIEAFVKAQNPNKKGRELDEIVAELATGYGPKGPRKLSELIPPHRDAYLKELTRPSGGLGADDLGGSLRLQADQYIRTKMGQTQVRDYVKHGAVHPYGESKANAALNMDHAKARAIDDNVWLDPKLQPYVETHLPLALQRYSDSFGYRVARQETINQITGQRGISWDSFFEWYKGNALRGVSTPERQAIESAFEAIDLKEKYMQGVSTINDNEAFKPYDVLATSTINLSRSAISAKNAFNQVMVETLPVVMAGGLDIGRFFQSVGAVIDSIRGNKKTLAGYSYFMEHMRTLASRNVYDGDQATAYSRNWLEQGFLNPAARLGEIAKSPKTPVSTKLTEGFMSMTDAVAQMSRALSFEDAFNTGYKSFAVGGEVYSFSKNWKGMLKLSSELSKKQDLTPKEFNAVCRKVGIDPIYARRLNDAGLLDPKMVRALELVNDLNKNFLAVHQRGKTLDADLFSELVFKLPSKERQAAGEAFNKAHSFIERMVDSLSVRPGLQDISARPANRNPFGRIFRAFTTWTTSFFNRAVVDRVGNAPWYKAYGMLGLAAFGEFAYLEANKLLYRGYTVDEVKQEWQDEPYNVMYQAGLRSHLLGPLGDMGFLVASSIGEFNTGYTGSSTTGMAQENAIRTLKSLGSLAHAGASSEVDANPVDANRVMRLVPLVNSPAIQFLAKTFGHRTTAGFLMDDDVSPLSR